MRQGTWSDPVISQKSGSSLRPCLLKMTAYVGQQQQLCAVGCGGPSQRGFVHSLRLSLAAKAPKPIRDERHSSSDQMGLALHDRAALAAERLSNVHCVQREVVNSLVDTESMVTYSMAGLRECPRLQIAPVKENSDVCTDREHFLFLRRTIAQSRCSPC
jgi:hypothetical protein